jgi:hypothetical protein
MKAGKPRKPPIMRMVCQLGKLKAHKAIDEKATIRSHDQAGI